MVKILVVDDEPDLELLVRQRFRRQIRGGEYAFVFAPNGAEALAVMEREPDVELVLTDINMPVMDGLTLLARLGEMDLMVKSVIVSAYGDMTNIRTAMNRGAADFLTKPIDFADLEITVQKTLHQLAELKESAREHERLKSLERELDIAASIQQAIVPRQFVFPGRSDFELFAEMIPAREVGGDFYDFFLIDAERLALVIADVSGKGVPAALFMAMSRALLKATALLGVPPAECLRLVNAQLCRDNRSEMFVTVFYGVLDTASGRLEYGNAGHNPPYVVRAGGGVESVPRTGDMVLGGLDGISYHAGSSALAPGDTLVLYTDGVTEAMDADERLFTEGRLEEYLGRVNASSPEDMIRGMVEEVRRFAGETPRSDDLTALAVVYRGR